MNKLLLLCMAILISMIALAQSNFDKGFQVGYKEGYCHMKTGCIAPNPPIPPIPGINESLNSYMDGYNRGFVLGYNTQKSLNKNTTNQYESQNSETSTPQTNRQHYQTTTPENIDFMYKGLSSSDLNNIETLSKILYEVKGKAWEHLENEDYYSVISLGKKGLAASPYDDEFMMLIGEGYRRLGDKKNAIRYYTKAYRTNNDPNIYKVIVNMHNNTDIYIK